jgi:hypothetical protein
MTNVNLVKSEAFMANLVNEMTDVSGLTSVPVIRIRCEDGSNCHMYTHPWLAIKTKDKPTRATN